MPSHLSTPGPQAGADVTALDGVGRTPAEVARQHGQQAALLLLERETREGNSAGGVDAAVEARAALPSG